MTTRVKIYFDGGWRPASGMETAVVVRGQAQVRQGIGPGSGMTAEWLALLEAMRVACDLGTAQVVLLGDALAVIAQATGAAAFRDHAAHLATMQAMLAGAPMPRIRHIKRSQNLAGIALARLHDR